MKIIFFGSPPSCINILNSLLENYNIISIVSKKQPEATKRRKIKQSEVSLFASKNNIPFLDPDILDSKFKDKLKKMKPDLFLVCAYGKILSDDFIKIPTYGTLNIHPSLLPQYRGPSPVQNTIINLDDDSGYTIIKMDKGIDTGDILFISEPISLRKNEKYLDLLNFLLFLGTSISKDLFKYFAVKLLLFFSIFLSPPSAIMCPPFTPAFTPISII